MQSTYVCKKPELYPIVLKDGTNVQTVGKNDPASLALLEKWYFMTGCPHLSQKYCSTLKANPCQITPLMQIDLKTLWSKGVQLAFFGDSWVLGVRQMKRWLGCSRVCFC